MLGTKKKKNNQKKTHKVTIKNFKSGIFIFALALFLRTFYLWQIKGNIFIQSPVSDSAYYFQRATEILSGNFFGSHTSFHSALLYPYFLAPLLAVKHDGLFALFFQILIGSVTCFLVYLIGRKIFNEFSGIASGFIAALYGFSIFTETQFLADSLIPFFICIMLVIMLYSKNKFKFFLVGIPLGLSALCKTTTLIFVPFLFIFLFLKFKKSRKLITHFGLLVLGIFLPMIPFSYMNYKTEGTLSPMPSGGGATFYVGNNINATGGFSIPKEMYPYYNNDFVETSKMVAEINNGRKLTSMEASTYWFDKASDFIRKNPLKILKLVGKKFILFWNKYESTCILDFYFLQNKYPLLKFILSFGIFAPLGILGIVLSDKRRSLILHFLLISILLTNLIFFVLARFRLPAVLVIIIFAGHALFLIWSQIKRKDWRRLGLYAIFLLCFYVFINLPTFEDVKLEPGYIHSIMSIAYRQKNNWEGAIKELNRCLEVSPRYPFAHAKLGEIYWERRDIQGSINEFQKETQVNPGNAGVHAELGRRYGMIGDLQRAQEQLEIAINLAPMMTEPRIGLGIVYRGLKKYDRAIEEFEKVLKMDPTSTEAYFNSGNVYMDKGDINSAIVAYKKALEVTPNDPELQRYIKAIIQNLSPKN